MSYGSLRVRPTAPGGKYTAVFFALFFVTCAAALIIVGLHRRAQNEPVPHGLTTTGVITGSQLHSGKYTSYSPTVRFTTRTGIVVTFTAARVNDRPRDGATVRVSYDPAHPTIAHSLSGDAAMWLLPFITGLVIGVLTIVLGGLALGAYATQRSGRLALR